MLLNIESVQDIEGLIIKNYCLFVVLARYARLRILLKLVDKQGNFVYEYGENKVLSERASEASSMVL